MTYDYRLCNVLLADGKRSEEHPELYMRQTPCVRVAEGDEGALLSPTCVCYDFATYLNAFSAIKWRRFTTVDNVWLRLEARGSFEVRYTGYRIMLQKPQRTVYERTSYDLDDYTVIDFCYPADDAAMLSFEIVCDTPLTLKRAYFFTRIEENALRDVELAVATTTFLKEDYVVPNIRLFQDKILGCDEPIARHFTLHVVDNGRTLDARELESDRVHIHPNPNVGGAGGFSRGMMEAMEQEHPATHVLLMDDDVQVHPEAIKRTFNVLRLLKDEYLGHFVSGAMLCLEDPNKFHEDVGFVGYSGGYRAAKLPEDDQRYVDVSSLESCMLLEALDPHLPNMYAAWWYCCIPVASIRTHGLALPFFIRGDDAEYGNRVANGFITMNGICIWHLSNAGAYKAAFERYYQLRNFLIAQAASGVYQNVDLVNVVHHFFGLDLKTFNYDSAELCLRGFEDFLRGPDHLMHLKTDETNRALFKKNEILVPLNEIDDPCMRDVSFAVNALPTEIGDRNLVSKAYDFLTFNGQRGPRGLGSGGVAVIPYDGWYYPANVIRGKEALLAVTADGEQGVLRKKDRARFEGLLKRYKSDMRLFEKNKDDILSGWAKARDELTSIEFWKRYLKEQAEAQGE